MTYELSLGWTRVSFTRHFKLVQDLIDHFQILGRELDIGSFGILPDPRRIG